MYVELDTYSLLPSAERQCMVLDGELCRIADRFLSVDLPASFAVKVAAICAPDPENIAAAGWSALWAWGLCESPRGHEITVRPGKRANHATEDSRMVHELSLASHEIINAQYGATITAYRASIDVLRHDRRDDAIVAHDVAKVILRGSLNSAHMQQQLRDDRSLPYRNVALRRLALVDAINVVHAIDTAHPVENTLEMTCIAGLKNETTERQTF